MSTARRGSEAVGRLAAAATVLGPAVNDDDDDDDVSGRGVRGVRRNDITVAA